MADNKEIENWDDQKTVTLTFDNDVVVECAVVAIFPVADKEYMALYPIEEADGIDAEELFIYRYIPSDNEEEDIILESIEDDDEYEAVADAFDKLLEEEDFDDLMEDEDEE